ncbi:hypothetical protein LOK49_LG12G02983 [Camellia lanceoleosa]|uniref:Uncharacterized protein n=1 Tax=Camellia lanceoleosa TaxID=1840588 RepID=A0ACC0FSR5_9ERIC|nr:hypothetical protein LOK49_LG12G02983 [Camellia lanceoleosa]
MILLTLYGSDVFLHRDKNLMPKNPAAWSAWNFLGTMDNKVCVTYWLNVLQVRGQITSCRHFRVHCRCQNRASDNGD